MAFILSLIKNSRVLRTQTAIPTANINVLAKGHSVFNLLS